MRRILAAIALLLGPLVPLLAQEPAKDATGDPLPKGAIARLGSSRMRAFDPSARLHPNGRQVIAHVQGKHVLVDPLTGLAGGNFAKGILEWGVDDLTPDGKRGVSTTFGGFQVWDGETGKTLYKVTDKAVDLANVSLSADGKFLAVGGQADEKDKSKGVSVRVYDVDAKKLSASLKVAQNSHARLRLSGDGKRGVSWGHHYEEEKSGKEADEDKDPSNLLEFWDVAAGKVKATGRMPADAGVTEVAMSPTGERVAASGAGGTIRLFDPATGKVVKELLSRNGMGAVLAFSADGKSLAAGSYEGAVHLWDVATGKSLGITAPPGGRVSIKSLVFTAPDRVVVLGWEGDATLVWEVPSGKLLSPDAGHRHAPNGLTFTAGDKEVVSAANEGEVIRWDTKGKALGLVSVGRRGQSSEPGDSGAVLAPPNSGLLLRQTGANWLTIHALDTGAEKFAVPGRGWGEGFFDVSPGGKRLVIGTSGQKEPKEKPARLSVIDVPDGTKVGEFDIGLGNVLKVIVTPDGKKAGVLRIQTNDKDETTTTFSAIDLSTGKVLGETPMKGFVLPRMVALDNSSALVATPEDGHLTVFDLTTGKKGKAFGNGKLTAAVGPVVSPDGKRVAFSPSAFEEVPEFVVYDVASGKKTHSFRGHTRPATCLAFSSDGNALATGSSDTTVLLWDLSKE